MKEALVLLGRLPRAHVRPPLVKLQHAEIQRIDRALVEAGLLGRGRSGPLKARTERASVT
jgi:4-hydroxy-tetrahydrodipicolinate synthase